MLVVSRNIVAGILFAYGFKKRHCAAIVTTLVDNVSGKKNRIGAAFINNFQKLLLPLAEFAAVQITEQDK